MLALLVLAILVVGGLAALRYVPLIDDVRGLRAAAQQFAASVRTIEPATLDANGISGLRDELADLDQRLEPVRGVVYDDPIVGLVRRLPVAGTQVDAATELVSAADRLVEAGRLGLGVADDLVEVRAANDDDPNFQMLPALVSLMVESGYDVERMGILIDNAESDLASIPETALGPIREARDLVAEPLDTYGPLLEAYREADGILPGLLGFDEPRRYLVLAQNPAELRPAGGYTGTVGVIGFEHGALVEREFRDVYELDLQPGLPFVEPPAELANHLLGVDQSWRLADAAWSGDFPTGARKALELYAMESGDDDIDGVIAITTYALDRLLEVVGPVEIEEFGVTVEPGDTTMTLLGETRGTETSTEGRKDILDDLAVTALQRLQSLPPDRWVPMADALIDIGTQKQALLWLTVPDAQRLLEDTGWAGALDNDPGDYVYALESNVAPTSKYNLVVDRSASLVAEVSADGSALSSLRLDWQNDADKDGQPYRSLRDFSNNEDGWYGSYLRLLLPREAELITTAGGAAEPIRGSDRLPDDAGRAAYGNYLFMPPGESTLTHLWSTPGAASETEAGWRYRLLVQKQPGARPQTWTFRWDLPPGAVVSHAPDGAVIDGNRVTLEETLDRDLELFIDYTLTEVE